VSQREHREGARAGEPALAVDLVDVFVYVVVLNLFVEYAPRVFSETFTLSLLTAVLLKAVLEGVALVKSWVVARLRVTATAAGRVGAAGLLWVVAAGSKFVVLELVALVFGDRVSLGGFVSVTLLIVTLLLCRAAVRRLLGARSTAATEGSRPCRG
jgi:hypothetical protein